MVKIIFSHYRNNDLGKLVQDLERDYYDAILHQCKSAEMLMSELQQDEVSPATTLYMSLCSKLLGQVQDFLTMRTAVLLPYVGELFTKNVEGHDCNNCSGNCGMKHASQLMGIKESHQRIKEILYRLQMVAMPLYTAIEYPSAYKILRNEMMMIDTALTELFYVEEAMLVPKIMEAQNHIHAHD
jgi:hypothetical protein